MTAIGFLTMIASSAVSLILTVVGTPLAQFKSTVNDSCITLWGIKTSCTQNDYTIKTADMDSVTCTALTSRLKAGEAFSIISIFFEAVVLTLTIVGFATKQNVLRWVSGALGIFAVAALIITWSPVAAIYNQDICGTGALSASGAYNYGAGFGLIVTSFCVMVVGSVAILVLPTGFDEAPAA